MAYDRNKQQRERYSNDPKYRSQEAKRARRFYRKHREKILRRKRSMQADQHVRLHYGITLKEVITMYRTQKGCCALCDRQTPMRGRKSLCIDHNHATGELRKLLCRPCNAAIGKLENAVWFAKAIAYLKETQFLPS